MIIGILGGGQLGMMIAEAAYSLGHSVIGLDPNPNCSLSTIADRMIVSEYTDTEAVQTLFNETDVITYEFENVDIEMIRNMVDKVPQKDKALIKSKNRLIEKDFASNLGIPTPRYTPVESKQDIFTPSVVKTITGGYDGKGQYYISLKKDIDHIENIDANKYICEEFIAYDYEISVVATRSQNGSVVFFPIPRNIHKNGILFVSDVSQDLPLDVIKQAKQYTNILLDELEYVGTLAVEFFVKDNDVIFNEFAPRPHNSGHYTIEGCNVSQFENHVRAITGDTLIEPTLLHPTMMLNIIGVRPNNKGIKNLSQVYLHDYYKSEIRSGRKMGHITFSNQDIKILNNTLQQLIEAYYE